MRGPCGVGPPACGLPGLPSRLGRDFRTLQTAGRGADRRPGGLPHFVFDRGGSLGREAEREALGFYFLEFQAYAFQEEKGGHVSRRSNEWDFH